MKDFFCNFIIVNFLFTDENDNEKLQTNATLQASPEFYNSDKKPLLKNQATSPKIPTPDPEDKVCTHILFVL